MPSEVFDIVDADDQVIGQALRSECHGDPSLVHRVSHVLVFNTHGEVLLQKRAENKDIQPGKWDTSVGGHLDPGENYKQAAVREMQEELGIENVPLTFLYHSKIRNTIESENIATYMAVFEDEIYFDPIEISDVRFWSAEEVNQELGSGQFTPNFEQEWALYLEWQRHYLAGSDTLSGDDSFSDVIGAFTGGDG